MNETTEISEKNSVVSQESIDACIILELRNFKA
jgi:hypothetical protein